MELHIRKKYGFKEEIHNIDEWKDEFFPGKDKRWKEGKSAQCLAEYILNSSPSCPTELMDEIDAKSEMGTIYCYPEHSTAFSSEGFGKGGPGGGRNHDLLIETPEMLITVEAKTDESFDQYVAEIITDTENRIARYKKTYKVLFGEETINPGIRYQLVQATVATIIEAKKRSKAKATLVVITFNLNYSPRCGEYG